MNEAPARGVLPRLREALLLEDAEAAALGYATGALAAMRAFVRAGAERALVAERALDDHPASALALYREAAVFYMAARASVASDGPLGEPLDAREVVGRFRGLTPRYEPPVPARELEAFLSSVAVGGLRAGLDGAAAAESTRQAERARAIVRWLATLVEPRGVDEVRFVRRFRLGTAAVVALALVAAAATSLLARENLALHKPTSASGVHPGSMAAPGGLTDGVISGAPYGVHTNTSDAPWVQVDLLAPVDIDKIKIYNRGDGFFDDGLPLTLQASEDGARFFDIETRTRSFGQGSPWVAKVHGVRARYVRVRGARGKYVALSELEVFGHPGR
ncbi:MAG TPA: discoidin domain-containing protein [Polyangia bacterium]|nr:discoidin domain-containing protein [Polyangia bacterium]